MRLIDTLAIRGIEAYGVLAPGIWKKREGECAASDPYEKLGIDNVLLPGNLVVPFARRRDLAREEGVYDEHSQAACANLHWAIDDNAIDRVNAHFDEIARTTQPGRHLLVVDELGQLELVREQGLTSAMALLDRGSSAAFPHALVIVRAQLLESAQKRFATAPWEGSCSIAPTVKAERLIIEQLSSSFETQPCNSQQAGNA